MGLQKSPLIGRMAGLHVKTNFEKEQLPGKTKGRSKDLKDSISGSSLQLSGSSSAKVININ